MRRITVKGFFKRLSLGMFLTCAAVILAESAVDGTSSADKSNAITNIVQDVIDSNHDSNTIVDIHDFNLSFNNEQYKDTYNRRNKGYTIPRLYIASLAISYHR